MLEMYMIALVIVFTGAAVFTNMTTETKEVEVKETKGE